MPITAVFAALLAPLFLVLSYRVIKLRGSTRTALGDGGNPELLRRMRVQANFAEYAPLALVLIGLAEKFCARRRRSSQFWAGLCWSGGCSMLSACRR